jgi:zinc transport system ATP-binding protein
MANLTPPLIQVQDLTFGYESSDPILDRVQLDIGPRDFLAVIGPNGGGKTTLLKAILGLVKPQAGRVIFNSPQLRRAIGYVPQFASFDSKFPLRVEEVVQMGRLGRLRERGSLHRYSDQDRQAVNEVMVRFHLTKVAQHAIDSLSGGQLQRALIARAIVGEPKILFLDEPLGSLDSESRQIVLGTLPELNREIPIVVITHDITLFAGMIRQVACLNRQLYYHPDGEINDEVLEKVYGCPVELVAHGVPHRVLGEH